MRVISGKYKGRKLGGYQIKGTRPVTGRIREAMFALINAYLEDAEVLDLFAGSGALGIEALSNGAKKAVFIDNNVLMIKELKKNISFIEEAVLVLQNDFRDINGCYDIIFLDPPYDSNYLEEALILIQAKHLLKEYGIIVIASDNKSFSHQFSVVKEKKYGRKKITILKKMEVAEDGKGPDC